MAKTLALIMCCLMVGCQHKAVLAKAPLATAPWECFIGEYWQILEYEKDGYTPKKVQAVAVKGHCLVVSK